MDLCYCLHNWHVCCLMGIYLFDVLCQSNICNPGPLSTGPAFSLRPANFPFPLVDFLSFLLFISPRLWPSAEYLYRTGFPPVFCEIDGGGWCWVRFDLPSLSSFRFFLAGSSTAGFSGDSDDDGAAAALSWAAFSFCFAFALALASFCRSLLALTAANFIF